MKQQQQHRVLMRLIMMNRGSRRTSLLFFMYSHTVWRRETKFAR